MRNFLIITILLVLASCSKYEVADDLDIDTSVLTVENIETSLAVINIEVNQQDFNYMYANYDQDIDVDAKINMFYKTDTILYNEDIEMNIKGAGSAVFPLKSLTIKLDDALDNSVHEIIKVDKHISTHFFDDIRKFSLRNSGNDFEGTYVKDICYTELAINQSLDLELSYYRPTQVFINNSYYGLLNLRTDKGKHGLSKMLHVDKDDINIIKINTLGDGNEELEFKDGDESILQDLVTAVSQGNTSLVKSMVDINSFVDYIVYQDFIGNSDWPHNNAELYSVGSGKFRFYLFDMDKVGANDKYFVQEDGNSGFLYSMFQTLKRDPDIESLLNKRKNEIFLYSTTNVFRSIVDKNSNNIENEIIYNISKYNVIKTRVDWYYNIQTMLDDYTLRRDSYSIYYDL